MANKARYYGLSTREEKQDVMDNSRAARIYPDELSYNAVISAVLNYKDEHPKFDELSSGVAASAIAGVLTKTGKYGKVSSAGSRITAPGYSIALTKSDKIITVSRKSEQVSTDRRKRKR